jgi:hypothetical protein
MHQVGASEGSGDFHPGFHRAFLTSKDGETLRTAAITVKKNKFQTPLTEIFG